MDFEPISRMSAFLIVFSIMAIWELLVPRRKQNNSKIIRFSNNIGLMVLNTFILRLAFPLGATGAALYFQTNTIGIFNLTNLPPIIEITLAIIILDLAIYFQHLFFHRIPILWRLHQVHHMDPEIDVSTAGRFHTIEILLSMLIKIAIIALIGADPFAVLLFEIVLNACAMFNHANIFIPQMADKLMRKIIVTPDMHRIHHSINPKEFNSNFGFSVSLWDKLFKTYKESAELGQLGMIIGQTENVSARDFWIDKLIRAPFKRR